MEVNLDGRRFATQGRVVTVALDPDDPVRRLLGIAFVDAPPQAIEILRDYIRRRLQPEPLPE